MVTLSQYISPSRRPLKIFAFDPMLGRAPINRVIIDVINEELQPGPCGSRVQVIDYDGARRLFYEPVNLNNPGVLMNSGMEPTESDPRFHQQMVYAVAMKTMENFDIALGRRLDFYRQKPLRLWPHAFRGANAFYQSRAHSIYFGYFTADRKNPGPNIPGQNVFSCLSHDIIAHEMTHALVDRLRTHFKEPTNEDAAAFHEGIADIVAIFQHLSFPEILRHTIQATRANLRDPSPLFELARQFGYATGRGRALRSAVERPDPHQYATVLECHERGSIVVAAVFDAFFVAYQSRIEDLLRIATGGTGHLPEGDLHPDLVNRIADEASSTAKSVLRMCIRALEYLPPVDVTFGDYLRALVTADFELEPEDETGLRAAMVEAFRSRGIYPSDVGSLAEDSLRWEEDVNGLDRLPREVLSLLTIRLAQEAYRFSRTTSLSVNDQLRDVTGSGVSVGANDLIEESEGQLGQTTSALQNYARLISDKLDLVRDCDVEVQGFHPAFRVAPHGQLLVEVVIQFVQTRKNKDQQDRLGGIAERGGTTLIVQGDGKVRYMVSRPLSSENLRAEKKQEAKNRLSRTMEFVAGLDAADPHLPWCDDKYMRERISKSLDFAAVHRAIGG